MEGAGEILIWVVEAWLACSREVFVGEVRKVAVGRMALKTFHEDL